MTRVRCQTAFCISFKRKLEKWIVKKFRGDHNHPLVGAMNTQFLWSHKAISNPDKAQLNAMRKVDVKIAQIVDYMI